MIVKVLLQIGKAMVVHVYGGKFQECDTELQFWNEAGREVADPLCCSAGRFETCDGEGCAEPCVPDSW